MQDGQKYELSIEDAETKLAELIGRDEGFQAYQRFISAMRRLSTELNTEIFFRESPSDIFLLKSRCTRLITKALLAQRRSI